MELNLENLTFYLIFLLPGLISMKVYSMLYATLDKSISEKLYDGLFYTSINLLFLVPLYFFISDYNEKSGDILYVLLYVIMLVTSIGFPFLLRYLYENTTVLHQTQLPYPTAWDYFFSRRLKCFIIFHLNDDTKIGGYFGEKSYSCSYPRHGDIYIQKVFKVNKDGSFGEIIKDSLGLIITKDEYKFIEIFEIPNHN